MRTSSLELTLLFQMKALRIKDAVPEYKFHPTRKWKFDFAWPEMMLAVEVEGGTGKNKGRHVRTLGFRGDCEKYNAAAVLGWLVLRGDSYMVTSGALVKSIEEAMSAKGKLFGDAVPASHNSKTGDHNVR